MGNLRNLWLFSGGEWCIMVEKTAKIAENGKKMEEYGTSCIVTAF